MIDIALKEWAVVCDLLFTGEQSLLIRKGGIEEADGPGQFRLEVPRFALFPAWSHQRPELIRPPWHEQAVTIRKEPSTVVIRGIGVVDDVWQTASRESLDPLEDLHAWAPEQLDIRWNYKPHQPLYVIAVRVFRLATPQSVVNNSRYAGCRSWIELEDSDVIDDAGATPVLSDAEFAEVVRRVSESMPS